MFECCFRSLAILLFVLDIAMLPSVSHAAPKPVPKSPYIGIVYRYADAVLAHGRDTQGPQATGLILSALDRKSIGPLTNRPHAPAGLPEAVRAGESNGPLVGANLLHDANLLRLLYTLSELSSKPVYRDAADGELKWLLQNAALTKSVGAPWDDGVAWNVILDEPLWVAMAEALPRRAWMLWDRSFELAPDVSRKWVLALCDQLADGDVAPRRAGFALRALASAFEKTKDGALHQDIESVVERIEKTLASSMETPNSRRFPTASTGWLSAAIDVDGAARRVSAPLATRLSTLAQRIDNGYCSLPHDLKGRHAFAQMTSSSSEVPPISTLWIANLDQPTTAHVAMMCVSRYENTGDTRYRDLIHAAADVYVAHPPSDDVDSWPLTFGQAISLELAAWRSTSRQEYLDRAIKLADSAIQIFWTDDSPLPKASSKSDHYESITGSDTLAMALVELHLGILGITAVRCPPNTIDR